METTKIMVALVAVVLIAGAAFAAQWGGEAWKNAPDEAKKSFMQATWSGNYATAKSLSEQYGLGGRQFERMNQTAFELRGQYHAAMAAGNIDEALKIKGQMQEQNLKSGAGMGYGRGGKNANGISGRGKGMHDGSGNARTGRGAGMNSGECPYAAND